MSVLLTIIGLVFAILGIAVYIKDVLAPDPAWYLWGGHVIGEIWFEWAPTSLQVTEAIISRYIDPCGLVVALGCNPFLWHPAISTLLNWYAAPSFIIFGVALLLFSRWWRLRKN